ncbi:hypothetical protein F3Y22_tig00020266pilonHSYRG00020 [Hibiscus syriacus]|uniref:Uncharacterized protein n=1 Tax=Hibiscus syriacus TaxID=106335 RepID=A0A6A3BY16_HIBSY|nr:hypothetical protein F3Y22_tig00020266pilonHSYRG00020 [Hibiscus syriacus]
MGENSNILDRVKALEVIQFLKKKYHARICSVGTVANEKLDFESDSDKFTFLFSHSDTKNQSNHKWVEMHEKVGYMVLITTTGSYVLVAADKGVIYFFGSDANIFRGHGEQKYDFHPSIPYTIKRKRMSSGVEWHDVDNINFITQLSVDLKGADVDATTKHGPNVIKILGGVTGNISSCAQLPIYLILSLFRKQNAMQIFVNQKVFDPWGQGSSGGRGNVIKGGEAYTKGNPSKTTFGFCQLHFRGLLKSAGSADLVFMPPPCPGDMARKVIPLSPF